MKLEGAALMALVLALRGFLADRGVEAGNLDASPGGVGDLLHKADAFVAAMPEDKRAGVGSELLNLFNSIVVTDAAWEELLLVVDNSGGVDSVWLASGGFVPPRGELPSDDEIVQSLVRAMERFGGPAALDELAARVERMTSPADIYRLGAGQSGFCGSTDSFMASVGAWATRRLLVSDVQAQQAEGDGASTGLLKGLASEAALMRELILYADGMLSAREEEGLRVLSGRADA